MALILNIDSTLQQASVTIAKDGEILMEYINDIQKDHAAFIHVATEKIAKEIPLKNIDAIAVTVGPGSYTGLRVGLAAAKGFAYTLQKPLITIGTLEAMAHTAHSKLQENANYYLCPLIDARRMEVFTAIYCNDLKEITPPHALILNENSFEEILKKEKCYFLGDGMQKCREIIKNKNAYFLESYLEPEYISKISSEKFFYSNFSNTMIVVPLYTKEFYNK